MRPRRGPYEGNPTCTVCGRARAECADNPAYLVNPHHREIALRVAIALIGLLGCVLLFASGWVR